MKPNSHTPKYQTYALTCFLLFSVFLFTSCIKQDKSSSPQDSRPEPAATKMTDPRDEETYKIVTIGRQTWMAENLRYNATGSLLNPDNPSDTYGRLYVGGNLEEICPEGWHLPTDLEWIELEIALGMAESVSVKTMWRGTHANKMKSVAGWVDNGNGTNSSGFNVLPTGYYFPGTPDGEAGFFDGLGISAGFWSSKTYGITSVRFFAAPREGVNRFEEEPLSGFANAIRCVKD